MFKRITLLLMTAFFAVFGPSLAWAEGNADADHMWMLEMPASGTLEEGAVAESFRVLPTRGGGQSLKRHQKVYMAFSKGDAPTNGGIVYDHTNKTAFDCHIDSDTTGTCTSAPLFISSTSALICTDGDIGTGTADATNDIVVRICADSICAAQASVQWGDVLEEGIATSCGEGGASGNNLDMPNLGGQWIYVELIGAGSATDMDIDDGDEVMVWVVGH